MSWWYVTASRASFLALISVVNYKSWWYMCSFTISQIDPAKVNEAANSSVIFKCILIGCQWYHVGFVYLISFAVWCQKCHSYCYPHFLYIYFNHSAARMRKWSGSKCVPVDRLIYQMSLLVNYRYLPSIYLQLPSLFAAWPFWTFHIKSHIMKTFVILSHSWSSPFLPLICLYGGKKWTFVAF